MFFNPIQNNGFDLASCLSQSGFNGHGGGNFIDPRFCLQNALLNNQLFGNQLFGSNPFGSPFGLNCDQFRSGSCPNGGNEWGCAAQTANGFSVEANGSNGCWARENIQYQACRSGVDASQVSAMNFACWPKGQNPVRGFDSGNFVASQAVLSWNFGDESWQKIKGWLEGKGLTFTRIQGKNKAVINVAAGEEQAFCRQAVEWNSSVVQFCSGNLWSGGNPNIQSNQERGGILSDGSFGIRSTPSRFDYTNTFPAGLGIGQGIGF